MQDFIKPELAGHIAYLLIFFSFLVRKMLYLRVFAIVASLFSTYYNFKVAGGPIWVPIQWNFVFIAVNVYHIAMIFMALRPAKLTDEEKFIHQKLFPTISAVDFRNFYELGYTRTYNSGNILIEQNEELPALFLIVAGRVDIIIDGVKVNELQTGQFIGEMSFLTREKTRATVQVHDNSKIHFWDRETLDKFLSKDQNLLNILHAAIGTQLINHIIDDSKSDSSQEVFEIKQAA